MSPEEKIASIKALCSSDMSRGPLGITDNTCTMAQMFLGEPEDCKGEQRFRMPSLPYSTIYQKKESPVKLSRWASIDGTQNGIQEAGRLALTAATGSGTTHGQKFGVAVCTTFAAAGQTLLGDEMSKHQNDFGGAAIRFWAEDHGRGNDGHEYLSVEDSNGNGKVIVDFWYAAAHDDLTAIDTEANIRNDRNRRWNLDVAEESSDRLSTKEKIKDVQDVAKPCKPTDDDQSDCMKRTLFIPGGEKRYLKDSPRFLRLNLRTRREFADFYGTILGQGEYEYSTARHRQAISTPTHRRKKKHQKKHFKQQLVGSSSSANYADSVEEEEEEDVVQGPPDWEWPEEEDEQNEVPHKNIRKGVKEFPQQQIN